MFKFLKDKITATISKISEKIKAEGKEEVVEQQVEKHAEAAESVKEKRREPVQERKGFFEKLKETFTGREKEPVEEKTAGPIPEKPKENLAEEIKAKPASEVEITKPKIEIEKQKGKEQKKEHGEKKREEAPVVQHAEQQEMKIQQIPEEKPKEEKRSFFQAITERIITKRINEKQFEDLFWDLELALLENNVAVEVIEKIKNDLKLKLVDTPIRRNKVEETISEGLLLSIKGLFLESDIDILKLAKNKKPYIVCFFGINGSGKTTSIAKLAKMLKDKGYSVVIAASDTFRAASIDQLQLHADKIGVKLIKHDYGADPAAVAFDAIKHAESKNVDIVLIDTAGRMHSNTNLVDEMRKIVRVSKPDLKIFVGEAITGNDCVEQAKTFNETIGIDGIILAKADIDERGGAAVSVSYVTKKPILYLGTGQRYEDLQKFEPEIVLKHLGLEA